MKGKIMLKEPAEITSFSLSLVQNIYLIEKVMVVGIVHQPNHTMAEL